MVDSKSEKFSGNVLSSFTGIVLLVSFGTLIWAIKVVATANDNAPWWIFIVAPTPSLLLIAIMTYRLFYFRVNDNSVEIRNQVLPWYTKEYLFIDINSASTNDTWGSRPRYLCITTIDLKNHCYWGASLQKRQWRALAEALNKRDIPTKSGV